jgi:hypothetical protein
MSPGDQNSISKNGSHCCGDNRHSGCRAIPTPGRYFQAICHARQGATLDELPARIDVSRSEAALILALHGGGEIRPERV